MAFKDALQDDLDNVFFNQEEFAELHSYKGNDIPVVVDDEKLTEMKLRSKEDHSDGLFSASKLIYVKESDVESEPFSGEYVEFDGKDYYIESVQNQNGIYTIILGANES